MVMLGLLLVVLPYYHCYRTLANQRARHCLALAASTSQDTPPNTSCITIRHLQHSVEASPRHSIVR